MIYDRVNDSYVCGFCFQELYKTVTGILNKLTPEKFDPLIEKIKNLPIDNAPRLQGVIDLIFDKVGTLVLR